MNKAEKKPLVLGVFSSAQSVKGQGVGSAYEEQVGLLEEVPERIEVHINEKGSFPLQHFHTINPNFYAKMHKKSVNIAYCHFLPETLLSSLRIPRLAAPLVASYVIAFYNRADYIVVVNPSFITDLVRAGIDRDKIVYIPNFVSSEHFHDLGDKKRKEDRARFGLKEDAFVVLGCGQVQNRKGVLDFVEVAKANPDLEFLWVGGFSFGRLTDGYEQLKEIMENPPQNVHFTGILDREEMPAIYNLADVLFVPSFSELFPMTILEASNLAKPIVTRDLPLYEGILFDHYQKASDNPGFSRLLRRLYEDPAFYEENREHSRELARFYSKEQVLQMWLDFYEEAYRSKFSDLPE